jgi:ribosomal protein S18 acetylase RimI-like enzyme
MIAIGGVDIGNGARLRRATHTDVDALIEIKRGLPMPRGEQTNAGGFLLGSELEAYRALLEVARTWLLEIDGRAVGFSLTLDDPVLRQSPVWARRDAIVWAPSFDVEAALARRIAYFDQLGVLPGFRRRYWGAALALRALAEQFDEAGHDLALTTTVIEPIINRAALPYLARVGARELGRVNGHYPGVGSIVSAVHVIEASCYRERMAALVSTGHPATKRIMQAPPGP